MNNESLTKKELYDIITNKIFDLGMDPYSFDYKINSIGVANKVCNNLEIKFLDFENLKLCGILYKGEKTTTIALNDRRSAKGQNFDCMHEVIHYWLHEGNYFYCNNATNDYYEWQANEGAAQFLMPYQVFIPYLIKTFQNVKESVGYAENSIVTKRMSEHFFVGKMAVENRVKSLRTEILQYCNSDSICDLNIQSLTKQGLNKKYNKNYL